MKVEIANRSELYRYVEDTLYIDLIQYGNRFEPGSLKFELPGVYLPGRVDPFLHVGKTYQYAVIGSETPTGETVVIKPDVHPKEYLDRNRDLLDGERGVVLPAHLQIRLFPKMTMKPQVSAMGCRGVVAVATSHLDNICYSGSNTQRPGWRMENAFLPEFLHMVETEAMVAEMFKDLVSPIRCMVTKFVNEDYFNKYYAEVRGSTLVIQKSMDYRIFEWYLDKFNKEEPEE